MKLDPVHDLQKTFREVVRLFTYPGRTANLSDIAGLIEPVPAFNPVMMLLGMVLLDGEVTFHFASDGTDGLTGNPTLSPDARLISELTYSRSTLPDSADFLFITRSAEDPLSVLRSVPVGTLVDPHRGATAILEVDRLGREGEPVGSSLTLSGPGIRDSRTISGIWGCDWVTARNEACTEYPLGIDILCVDKAGEVMAIPRTTRIEVPDTTRSKNPVKGSR